MSLGREMIDLLDEVQRITGMPSRPDTVRYVLGHGMQAMTQQIGAARMMRRVQELATSEEVFDLMREQMAHIEPPDGTRTEAKKRPKGSP